MRRTLFCGGDGSTDGCGGGEPDRVRLARRATDAELRFPSGLQNFIEIAARKVASDAARRCSIPANEVDDVVQELMMHVVREWHRYNPDLSAEAFANQVIKTKFVSILRKRKTLKATGRRSRSADSLTSDPIDPRPLTPAIRAGLQQDLDVARRELSGNALRLFDGLRVDPCPRKVALRLGLEGREMRTALERIRKVCTELGLKNYL